MANESSSWNREVSWNAESCTLRALERATLTREKKTFVSEEKGPAIFPFWNWWCPTGTFCDTQRRTCSPFCAVP